MTPAPERKKAARHRLEVIVWAEEQIAPVDVVARLARMFAADGVTGEITHWNVSDRAARVTHEEPSS